MKLKHSKHGLKANPIGAHVTLTLRGRTLLGEVRGASRNTVTGAIELDVRHFNGEPWPLRPTSWAVDVLARDYMRAEADALQEACLSDPDTREAMTLTDEQVNELVTLAEDRR